MLTAKSPIAVAREFPAKSVSMTAATGHDKSSNPDTAQARTTVSHGETGSVKAETAASPPAAHHPPPARKASRLAAHAGEAAAAVESCLL